MSSQKMLIDVSPSIPQTAPINPTIMPPNGTTAAAAESSKPTTPPAVKNGPNGKDNKTKIEAATEAIPENIRSVRYHEVEARQAYRLADAIYQNASEAELAEFGTAEERCQLLGLFTFQLMEIANISKVYKGVVFRAAAFNKLGYGKPMKLSLSIAKNEKFRRDEERALQGMENGVNGRTVNGKGTTNAGNDKKPTNGNPNGSGKAQTANTAGPKTNGAASTKATTPAKTTANPAATTKATTPAKTTANPATTKAAASGTATAAAK